MADQDRQQGSLISQMANLTKGTRRAVLRAVRAGGSALVRSSPAWMRQRLVPVAKHVDMLLVDHGLIRLVYLNRHRLGNEAWRSAQPSPGQLARFARSGVRTVVNLRGERDCGSYELERAACLRLGMTLVNSELRSRAAPTRDELRRARNVIQSIAYPALFHCKSGADRVGLMSVLYAHLKLGQPIAEARRQLSLRYGHIRQAKTGILDHFLDCYLADNAREPIEFFTWIETRYDPDALMRSFQSNSWADRLVDRVLDRE